MTLLRVVSITLMCTGFCTAFTSINLPSSLLSTTPLTNTRQQQQQWSLLFQQQQQQQQRTTSTLLTSTPEQQEMQSEETMNEHELLNLDLSKTIYISSMKSPKDAYVAFAEKGKANAKMAKRKIFHQSILGGCYVGFGALLSLSVAGTIE
jgi:hypothetical protein